MMPMLDGNALFRMAVNDAMKFRDRVVTKPAIESRACPLCGLPSSVIDVSPDGVKQFVCAKSHQMFVTPVGER